MPQPTEPIFDDRRRPPSDAPGATAPVVDPDPRRDRIRAAFLRERGFWAPPFEAILQADPDFIEGYLAFSSAPWRNGPLEPKIKELIYIAVDASVTHLHHVGTASHIRSALRHGATPEEISAVLQLVSLIGLQSLELGLVLLDQAVGPAAGEAQEQAHFQLLAAVDPEGARAARAWQDTVQANPALPARVRELIGIAVNASTTHLNVAATERHIKAALEHGATPAEITEVLELISVLGIHSATMAMPLLARATQD